MEIRGKESGGYFAIEQRSRLAKITLDTLGYVELDAHAQGRWAALAAHARARAMARGLRLSRRNDLFHAHGAVISSLRCVPEDTDAVMHAAVEILTCYLGWCSAYEDLRPDEPISTLKRPRHRLVIPRNAHFADRRTGRQRRRFPVLAEFDLEWTSGMVECTERGLVVRPDEVVPGQLV